jgi:hypothetical protein
MKIEMSYLLLAFAMVLAPMARGQSTAPQPTGFPPRAPVAKINPQHQLLRRLQNRVSWQSIAMLAISG